MLFKVNEGQSIRHFNGKDNVMLAGGQTIEGPEWWRREFAGRMTAIDAPPDDADPQLATAKPHERVSLLKDARERLAQQQKALDEQIAQSERDAKSAQDEASKGEKSDKKVHRNVHPSVGGPSGSTEGPAPSVTEG